MTDITKLTGLDGKILRPIVSAAIHGADDGELFIEHATSESVFLQDGQVGSSRDTRKGFGLRRILDEMQAYVYSNNLNLIFPSITLFLI